MSVNKQAESGIPDVSAHRELAPHEEEALAAGKSRWMPRVFQSYGTPIPELMASPLKTGLIFGVPAGIIGAGLGSAMGGKNHGGMGALIGGLGAGGLAAIAAGMDREAKNEGLEELMRRMPEGAAKRDLLADPQYQSDFLGWDNNKIVATARARYYRPTERFSKRTFDMADARARYNERHKSSSVNKDDSMNEKQAEPLLGFMAPMMQKLPFAAQAAAGGGITGSLAGAGAGALYGALSSRRGKRLGGALRGLAGGAGIGGLAGGALGAGAGMHLQNQMPFGMDPRLLVKPAHVIDNNNKDDSMNEKQSMFGVGVPAGALLGLATSQKGKRLRAAGRGALKGLGSDIGSGTGALLGAGLGIIGGPIGMGIGGLAGGLGGSYLGAKTMGEVLGPYDNETDDERLERMLAAREKKTNSTETDAENKKVAQALLDNKSLTLAEKMAAYKHLLTKQALTTDATLGAGPFAPTSLTDTLPGTGPVSLGGLPAAATMGAPSGMADLPSGPANSGAKLPYAAGGPGGVGSVGAGARVIPSAGGSGAPKSNGVPGRKDFEILKQLVGYDSPARGNNPGVKRDSTYYKAYMDGSKVLGENVLYPIGKGLYNAPGALLGAGRSAVGAGIGAGKALGNWLHPAVPEPTMMDKLKPYAPYAMLGAGGLGALALADYMSRRSTKKKPKNTSNNEEYDMPKAASVNWYQLARQRQKYAMSPTIAKPIVALGPNILARLAAMRSGAGALASRGRDVVSGLPTWAKVTGGLGLSGGAGAGIGALGGMFSGKDPSMLQQIMNSKYTPYAAAGLGAAGLLGGAAYMGNNAGKNEAKKKKPEGEKKADLANALSGGGMGALAGGGLGALYGALAPGYEQDPDTGRRRRRSRLLAALRGGAAGAAGGGLAGGAIGHFAGGNISDVLSKYLAKKEEAKAGPAAQTGISTDKTLQADPLEAAKREAMQGAPAPQVGTPSPAAGMGQGPTDFNATMGASVPPGPGLQNTMPQGLAPAAPNPMPAASPAAGMGQGPTNFNSTMGGMPQRPMM